MIAAASQTLAGLLARGLTQISHEQISFAHPRLWRRDEPGLNLYCYHVQAAERDRCTDCRGVDCRGADCQWFDLTFLISVADHTPLGEQNLLSTALVMLSQCPLLPDAVLERSLQGYGTVNMKVFTQAPIESILFWAVLCAPFQLALHVTLTVPVPLLSQAVLIP